MEVVQAYIDRIQDVNPLLNAVIQDRQDRLQLCAPESIHLLVNQQKVNLISYFHNGIIVLLIYITFKQMQTCYLS